MSHSTVAAASHTGVPAPGNFRIVVNDDDSLETSWDAVDVPGVRYTLKEAKNPDGLSNARNITATTSHRTPPVPGDYEYWVVAVKDGVESADSDHVRVSLPHGGTSTETHPSGTQSSASPAEILQIGGAGGHWELGVGLRPADAQGVTTDDDHKLKDGILTVSGRALHGGFVDDPYFLVAPGGTAVRMQAFMVGGIVSESAHGGSKFPRTELRELEDDGTTKAAWDAAHGLHVLSGRTAVLHMPPKKPRICVAQIHGTNDDTLELRVESKGSTAASGFRWSIEFANGNIRHDPNTTQHPKGDYSLGDEAAWEIKVENGTVTVTVDDTELFHEDLALPGQYFKTGCYTQSNHADTGNPETEFEAITLRDLRLVHQSQH